MLAALGWGALAASSLVIGALLALARDWSRRLVGLVLAFGAGALISAVAFELALEGDEAGGFASLAAGLALGALLDGIPEQAVLGIGLAGGEPVSVGLLCAIFVSNLPEAIGSASALRDAGRSGRRILGMWVGVAVVTTLATVGGFALGDAVSGELRAAIDGFAAGALLVMLVDSMIPEAVRDAGRQAGLVTALGFAAAAALSIAS